MGAHTRPLSLYTAGDDMELIDQTVTWHMKPTKDALDIIEMAGRTCYQSFDKPKNPVKFIKMLLGRKHESVLEHAYMSFRFITSRAMTHELVRHRLASFSQESQRYVRADKGEVVKPYGYDEWSDVAKIAYLSCFAEDFFKYNKLIEMGIKPQIARGVLANDVKTDIVMTANFREWRHVFKLRLDKAAHPQMRELIGMAYKLAMEEVPCVFEDVLQN